MSKQLVGTGQISLTKVAKGSIGESAKYLTIAGEQIFRYSDSEMKSISVPENITLTATIFNINTTDVKWYYRTPNNPNWTPVPLVSTYQLTGTNQYVVDPNASYWAKNTSMVFACVVNGQYYDEVSIVKLAEGEAFSAFLTNETQTIPTYADGSFDLETLQSIQTEVQVFRGTEKLNLAANNENPSTYEYTIRCTDFKNLSAVINNKTGVISVSEFASGFDQGSFGVEITIKANSSIGGNKVLKKTFTLTKAKQGEAGPQGADAKYVTVTGENLFVISAETNATVTPSKIKLIGISHNLEGALSRRWERLEGDAWINILHTPGVAEITHAENNFSTLTLYPNSFDLETGNYLVVRYWVDAYSDEMSIAKISESSGYISNLTNQSHTVAVDKDGEILDGELALAYTEVEAYKNTSILQAVDSPDKLDEGKFYAVLTSIQPESPKNQIIKASPTKFALSSMEKTSSSVTGTIKIYFEDLKNFQEKIVTFTKARTGADGKPGEDAYMLNMTKQSSIIRLEMLEGQHASHYDDAKTEVVLYKGGSVVPLYSEDNQTGVSFELIPDTATTRFETSFDRTKNSLKLNIIEIASDYGYVDINITAFDNNLIKYTASQRFSVTVISEGNDAKYVNLTSDSQAFIFENKVISSDKDKNIVSPEMITLTANIHNFIPNSATSNWQFLDVDNQWKSFFTPFESDYILVEGTLTYTTFINITPYDDVYKIWKSRKSVNIRYIANGMLIYSDSITLQKVQDQKTMIASLTNENITLVADDAGIVQDYSQAITNFNVFYSISRVEDSLFNVQLLTPNKGAELVKIENKWALRVTNLTTNLESYKTLVSMTVIDENTNESTVLEQELTFTVSKARQGRPGIDGEVGPAGPDGMSVYTRYLVSGYMNDTYDEYHYNTYYGTTATRKENYVRFLSTNQTPYINMAHFGVLETSLYKYIMLKYRLVSGTPGTMKVRYHRPNGENFSSTAVPISPTANEWKYLFISMADAPYWTWGGNQAIALDLFWTTNSSVTIDIEHISVVTDMTDLGGDYIGLITANEVSLDINAYHWSRTKSNSYDWLGAWNENKTLIGDKYIASPEAFIGRKNALGKLDGIALGMKAEGDTDSRTGIIGYNNGVRTFTIDRQTGIAQFGDKTSEDIGSGQSGGSYIEVGPDGLVGQLNAKDINVANISASNINTGTLNANEVNVTNLNASNITAGQIQTDRLTANIISAVNASIESATINSAKIGNIEADKITTGTLDASQIRVVNLQASSITAGQIDTDRLTANVIDAVNASIGNATIDSAKIGNLSADQITSGTIDATLVNVTNLNASNIVTGSIDANEIEVKNLKGGNIIAESITGAQIAGNTITGNLIAGQTITAEHIAGKTITADQIAAGSITAGSGVIADGAIGNAQISNLNASKINAGTIDTSNVSVLSADASIEISGNQIMINDTTDPLNKKNRVTLGEYILNGIKNFGLIIRGKDGKTVMFDENGVHNAGITDGAIDNNKVADDANINGKKLDINSVVRSINEDGSETIAGTKVQVGDRTLDIELSTQNQKITDNSTEINSQKSQITALDDKISLKVDSQEYSKFEETITNRVEEVASNVPYQISILASNGTSFTNGNIDTILQSRVVRGIEDITNTIPNSDFSWIRESSDPEEDAIWNSAHVGVGPEIHVTARDFRKRAVFSVDVILPK